MSPVLPIQWVQVNSSKWVRINKANLMNPIQWVQCFQLDASKGIHLNESNSMKPIQWVHFNTWVQLALFRVIPQGCNWIGRASYAQAVRVRTRLTFQHPQYMMRSSFLIVGLHTDAYIWDSWIRDGLWLTETWNKNKKLQQPVQQITSKYGTDRRLIVQDRCMNRHKSKQKSSTISTTASDRVRHR